MAINAKNVRGNVNRVEQEALEAGAYPARLVQVIDMGIQPQQSWEGEEKPPAHELMTTYEFVDEFIKDKDGNLLEDQPRWLSENFALRSLNSDLAKSTKRYFALDPDASKADGDWGKLLGEPVIVTLVQNPGKGKNVGKTFNKITATSSMRKKEADKLPNLKKEGKVFDFDDAGSAPIMLTLPDWVQKKIKSALNWEGSKVQKALADGVPQAKKEEEPEDEIVIEEDADDENW